MKLLKVNNLIICCSVLAFVFGITQNETEMVKANDQRNYYSEKILNEYKLRWVTIDEKTGEFVHHDESELPRPNISTYEGMTPSFNNFSIDKRDKISSSVKGIVPPDDRSRIDPTDIGPYNSTVKIEFGNNGDNGFCTGFLIGPRHVATAGHCLISGNGFRQDSIVVKPALNGTQNDLNQNVNGYLPYGSSSASIVAVGEELLENGSNIGDWGILAMEYPLGNSIGWLGLRWQLFPYSSGTNVLLNGYTNESVNSIINYNFMYLSAGEVTGNDSFSKGLVTNLDSSGNQSGGPIYRYYNDTGYTAIAILRGGSNEIGNEYSDGRIIDYALYNLLISYR